MATTIPKGECKREALEAFIRIAHGEDTELALEAAYALLTYSDPMWRGDVEVFAREEN